MSAWRRVAKESSEMLEFLERYLLRSSLDCHLAVGSMMSQTAWKLFPDYVALVNNVLVP